MKRLILTFFLTICLIVSAGICLTVYADDTGAAANDSTAESTTNSQVDVVRDMINALPDVEKVEIMGYSDKYKAYVDMKAADTAYENLSQEEKDSLGVLFQVIDNVKSYFNMNPLPSGDVSYGFLMDQTLVTSQNRSGKGWSYDPDTQTLTLGDENEISVLFATIPKKTDNYWQKHYKNINGIEREVFYTAVLQPVVATRDVETNSCTFSLDRPSNLKINVKRTTSFGTTAWSGEWGQYSDECGKWFEMCGIFWDGNLEITGGGLLSLHATTYAIEIDKVLNIHDAKLEVQAYNSAIYCGSDLKITNSTVNVKSNSLGAQHYDLQYKRVNGEPEYISDSIYAIDCGGCTIKDSTVTADAAWNRVYTTEKTTGDYGYTVAALYVYRGLKVYNSFVSATAHIDEGWQHPAKQEDATICGIGGSLELYDDAFVFSKTYADSYFNSHSDQLSKVYFYGWDGKTCYGYGNAVLIGATERNNTAFWEDYGSPIKVSEGVQYTISTPENYSGSNRLIVEYRKADTLYLRDQDGKKQASWKMDFSDCVELESNVVDEADFTSQVEGRPCNVRVASGNFTFNALPNSQADRFFETLSGSLTVQLDKGENYGDVHVFTAPSSSITLQGQGTMESLIVKPHIRINHKDYDVETGSLTIDVATVKNCKIDKAYKDNVSFDGGNIKVDISDIEYYRQYFKSYYDTMIYDFNSLTETVDLAKMSTNHYYNTDGAQLIDGKFYFYAKKTDSLKDFVKTAYVKPSAGYNYYVLPENEKASKMDDITTYTFRRATETLSFLPKEEIKYAYVSVGEKDVTIDAGYAQAYVTDSAITGGDGFALTGSETQTLPEGYFAKWFYTDEKTDEVTQLIDEGQSLLYTINNVVLEDEFRTYTCEVYRKDAWYHIPMGSYSIKPRIMIMSASPSSYTLYVKKGDTVPLKLTVDENCRDNWRQDLVVSWQARKDADSDWIELPSDTYHNPTYNLKFTSEEMISWEYRAKVGPYIRPIGVQSAPDYYSNSIFFCKRGETKFKGAIENISGKNGEYCGVSVGIEDGYLSSIECYWERSQDNGKTWSKVIHDGNVFTIIALTFSKKPSDGGTSVDYTTSTSLTVKLDSSLNGDKLRAVIYDKLSDTYVYTNESLITVTDHVHEWSTDEIIAEDPANCTVAGTKAHWHCDTCNKDFEADKATKIDELTIAAKGHTWSTDEIIAEDPANCTEAGTKAHWHCDTCNKNFEADKTTEITELTIAAKGHTWSTDEIIAEVPANCTDSGTKGHYECTVCGKYFDEENAEIKDLTINALGHTWSTSEIIAEVPASCTASGTKAHWHCNTCNKDFESDKTTKIEELTIAAKGHNFGEWIEEVAATEKAEGVKAHKDCTVCGKHFDENGNELESLAIEKLPESGLSGGAVAGIVVGGIVVLGGGGFSIFWFVIKKKKWADLVALFAKK